MLDIKEEQKYEELKKLAQELHIPMPEAFWELEVILDGKVIQTLKQRSHSWTRNAYNLLLSQMASKNLDSAVGEFGAGFLSIKDTGAVVRRGAYGASIASSVAVPCETTGEAYRAGATITTFGIQVGSGTNAESFEDYVLQTLIAEGTGAGQLNYVAMDIPTKSWAAPTFTIIWIRYMNNNSAGTVNVNEVALGTYGRVASVSSLWINSRDKLVSTVTIPATGQLKVTYTIQLTYPA